MRLRRVLQLTLLFALFWVPASPAQAHATLVTSSPAVGSHIDTLPKKVTVTFDGNLLTIGGAKTNVMTVTDPTGKEIDANNSSVTGAALSVDLNPTPTTGEFLVSWRVVSGDGHPEQSSYRFTINGPSAALLTPNASSQGPHFWNRYRTRILLVLGLLIAIGIWAAFERARRKSE